MDFWETLSNVVERSRHFYNSSKYKLCSEIKNKKIKTNSRCQSRERIFKHICEKEKNDVKSKFTHKELLNFRM